MFVLFEFSEADLVKSSSVNTAAPIGDQYISRPAHDTAARISKVLAAKKMRHGQVLNCGVVKGVLLGTQLSLLIATIVQARKRPHPNAARSPHTYSRHFEAAFTPCACTPQSFLSLRIAEIVRLDFGDSIFALAHSSFCAKRAQRNSCNVISLSVRSVTNPLISRTLC